MCEIRIRKLVNMNQNDKIVTVKPIKGKPGFMLSVSSLDEIFKKFKYIMENFYNIVLNIGLCALYDINGVKLCKFEDIHDKDTVMLFSINNLPDTHVLGRFYLETNENTVLDYTDSVIFPENFDSIKYNDVSVAVNNTTEPPKIKDDSAPLLLEYKNNCIPQRKHLYEDYYGNPKHYDSYASDDEAYYSRYKEEIYPDYDEQTYGSTSTTQASVKEPEIVKTEDVTIPPNMVVYKPEKSLCMEEMDKIVDLILNNCYICDCTIVLDMKNMNIQDWQLKEIRNDLVSMDTNNEIFCKVIILLEYNKLHNAKTFKYLDDILSMDFVEHINISKTIVATAQYIKEIIMLMDQYKDKLIWLSKDQSSKIFWKSLFNDIPDGETMINSVIENHKNFYDQVVL